MAMGILFFTQTRREGNNDDVNLLSFPILEP